MAGLGEARGKDRAGIDAVTRLASFLTHPWLTVRVQIGLGLIFIIAALPKIVDPPSFAHMVLNYRILPGSLVNLSALVLPWFELLAGLALVLGIFRRTASVWIGVLLCVFMGAIALNLFWDNPIECGCFDPKDAGKSVEERFFDMKALLLRDAGMLLMVAQSLWAERSRRVAGAPSPVVDPSKVGDLV
ncbi:MAG: hypothetical protein DIJKHBIC_01973 [Thermoanaerobaculia bacterium]|nr:hypothetical protein [Thermoanaerobaculia bacterium]